MHGKLPNWKEKIKTNFHSQDGPFDMYYDITAMLKIDSVYKQSKNCHPHIYAEECKNTNAESQQCRMLSDSDDDGYFVV